MENKIHTFIALCRKTFGRYEEHSGGCYKFHLLLKSVFGGIGFYNGDHVITLIGGVFYDIDGEFLGFDREYHKIGGKHYPHKYMEDKFKEYL